MEKKKLNTRALIPVATAIVAIVFIAVGMIDFGFWDGGPTPGFFPIIIAVVLLLASIASFIQVARDKDGKDVQYNRAELMVILGAAGIIIGSMVIGLIVELPGVPGAVAQAGGACALEACDHHRGHSGRHHHRRICGLAAGPVPHGPV